MPLLQEMAFMVNLNLRAGFTGSRYTGAQVNKFSPFCESDVLHPGSELVRLPKGGFGVPFLFMLSHFCASDQFGLLYLTNRMYICCYVEGSSYREKWTSSHKRSFSGCPSTSRRGGNLII